eukprot:491241-Amphidinium_carterae.1
MVRRFHEELALHGIDLDARHPVFEGLIEHATTVSSPHGKGDASGIKRNTTEWIVGDSRGGRVPEDDKCPKR